MALTLLSSSRSTAETMGGPSYIRLASAESTSMITSGILIKKNLIDRREMHRMLSA